MRPYKQCRAQGVQSQPGVPKDQTFGIARRTQGGAVPNVRRCADDPHPLSIPIRYAVSGALLEYALPV